MLNAVTQFAVLPTTPPRSPLKARSQAYFVARPVSSNLIRTTSQTHLSQPHASTTRRDVAIKTTLLDTESMDTASVLVPLVLAFAPWQAARKALQN